ncbi:MBL fold metallo-hydrolase [Brucellaceae bacterium D45D]
MSEAAPISLKRHHVGALTITRIDETELVGMAPQVLFPDLAGEAIDPALFPAHMSRDGGIRLASHAWLVEGPQGRILIDTGIGAGKQRPLTPMFHELETDFLARLAEAGVRPADIDWVLHTHLHVDHVGWNTRAEDGVWLPTFANARHVFSGEEYRYYADPVRISARTRNSFLARQDSVDPIVANGQAMMISVDGSEVLPGICFLSTPGHSPFHASILIASEGQTALFAGDTLHHVAQVLRPQVNSVFDADPEAARTARAEVLALAAKPGVTLFGAHVSGSSVLRITQNDNGYIWTEI